MAADDWKTETDEKDASLIRRQFSVALNRASPSCHNTLILGGVDLIVPLEKDLDKDPNTADEICLRSDNGWYENYVTSDNPAVRQDGENPLLLYPFQDVPPGLYKILVKVGDQWREVLSGLRVTRDDVLFGERSIVKSFDGSVLGTPIGEPVEEEEFIEEEEKHFCGA